MTARPTIAPIDDKAAVPALDAGRSNYWADFYSRCRKDAPSHPSQFAAFAINEFDNVDGVIEFGCGNGRDSHFFASNGLPVLALDACEQAIALCRARNWHEHASYVTRKASAARGELEGFLHGKRRVAAYARFFLHTIEEDEQRDLLCLLGELLPSGSPLFLEYRTVDDMNQQKAFGTGHYRRYLDHRQVLSAIGDAGFQVTYEIEGRGLAKYGSEDAIVGRCLAMKA